MYAREGLHWIKKKYIFSWTPCTYLSISRARSTMGRGRTCGLWAWSCTPSWSAPFPSTTTISDNCLRRSHYPNPPPLLVSPLVDKEDLISNMSPNMYRTQGTITLCSFSPPGEMQAESRIFVSQKTVAIRNSLILPITYRSGAIDYYRYHLCRNYVLENKTLLINKKV